MTSRVLTIGFVLAALPAAAQAPYKLPPKELVDIIDAPPPPQVVVSPTGDAVLLVEPEAYPPSSERRSLWDAPQLCLRVSPFSYANKIGEPILLIHGEADNNSGTYSIQSERLFQALRGNGGTSRYVVLPFESHGYRARESVLHTLAEMIEWADQWAKKP